MTAARALTSHLADLLRQERFALADFLLALADFDRRKLWLELGYPSLFTFLHRELGLSKGAAHYRKTAAELVRRFPEVEGPLRDGRLCITSIVELARVISPENRAEVLPRFFHRSKREAREVAVEISPREAVPRREVVTAAAPKALAADHRGQEPRGDGGRGEPAGDEGAGAAVHPVELLLAERAHPVPQVAGGEEAAGDDAGAPVHPDELVSAEAARQAPAPARGSPHTVEPLTADLRRLHVTVSRRFLDKLEAARAALSHARPGASADEVLEAGLDLLLEQHARKKGLVARPRPAPPPAPDGNPTATRHIPARVRREVWTRDGGRCQWPLQGGGTCESTLRVEFDHIVPLARGGPSTAGNLRLACALHNQVAARQAFGGPWMDRFRRHGGGDVAEGT